MNENEAYIALNMMDKIGPITVAALVSHLGSAAAIFEADYEDLLKAEKVGEGIAAAILEQRASVPWQAEIENAAGSGLRIITRIDEEYPDQLRQIHDPPLALYITGKLEGVDRHSLAVVGTRRPTHYGKECAERFSYRLAQSGFTVVSGLAEGIDTFAHRGALKAKGRTIAVIGSALDQIYPQANLELADRIAGQGAVVSEFPLGKPPDRTTFPMRNRIVSGLAQGVLVVEAGARSGALITAHQALDQGRSVFAVPGRIDSAASHGTHELIRNGACLVTDVSDILEEFEFLPNMNSPRPLNATPKPQLSEEENRLLGLVKQGEQGVDSLIRSSGLKPSQVSSLLMSLEIKRIVRMLPGRIVEMADMNVARDF